MSCSGGELRCVISEYQGPVCWRWVLTGPDGTVLAEHDVRLDEYSAEYEAFIDLWTCLDLRSVPDRRDEQRTQTVAALGEWIGRQVFGPVGTAMVCARPAAVRVVVPAEARQLACLPFELAHVDGRPVAGQGVTFVVQTGDQAPEVKAAVGDRLRVLGLFSLPTGDWPLDLRRERHGLTRLFDEIADSGRAVEARMLQYGVTRARLVEILDDGEGWDIVHFSSHGRPGTLNLENDDGSGDQIEAGELVELLAATRRRLKLVTLSACSSAAEGDDDPPDWPSPALVADAFGGQDTEPPPAALATELVDELDCAVLAMRYPVVDGFAIELGRRLYGNLVGNGQTLARALGAALHELNDSFTALSVATPALFGARAVDLQLAAPERPDPGSSTRECRWLEPPRHFVGRTDVMVPASAALLPSSCVPGVLLLGMAGVGKSACALELIDTHDHLFEQVVAFDAREGGTPRDFLLTVETDLLGSQLSVESRRGSWLQRRLATLTETLRRRPVLVVLDDVDLLLDMSGRWLDAGWLDVIGALVDHKGPSRLIMISRRRPKGLPKQMPECTVSPLPQDEARHLALRLPNLDRLNDDAALDRLLEVAQGHPGFLHHASRQAADPDGLRALLATDAPGVELDYTRALTRWTETAVAALTVPDREVFFFLCCLEPNDRFRWVVEGSWEGLRRMPGRTGTAHPLGKALSRLASVGLISIGPSEEQQWESYSIQPLVSAHGSATAGPAFHHAVDRVLGSYWTWQSEQARESSDSGDNSWVVVMAGVNAAPYLLRLGDPVRAAALLEQSLFRDRSLENVAQAVPVLETLVTVLTGTPIEESLRHLLARTWEVFDLDTADTLMRQVMTAALAKRDFQLASLAAGGLAEYSERFGRLKESLTFAEQRITYTRRAGLGRWSQLGAECQHLDVLASMGHSARVLDIVTKRRAEMLALPHESGPRDPAHPFKVRENLLGIGAVAALRQKRWADALDFIGEQVKAKEQRFAPMAEIARARFNAYGAYLGLGRWNDARILLWKCREILDADGGEDHELAIVLGAVSDLDDDKMHGDIAVKDARDALRYAYRATDPRRVQTGHHNLGRCLAWYRQDAAGLAHLMAAALVCTITGIDGADESVEAMAFFRAGIANPAVPGDVADLCRRVAEIDGVDLSTLLGSLVADQESVALAFDLVLAQARKRGAA